MFSVVSFDRLLRTLKALACFVLAAAILRAGYQLPPATGADVLPEFVCVLTAFFLGLTALAIAFRNEQDFY